MRGKGGVKVLSATERRITPAYAGKSSRLPFIPTSFQDHPRLCGEKHFEPVSYCCGIRITPAYAGKSLGSISIRSHIRDHPRLCGEKSPAFLPQALDRGSPPPMRGKDRNAEKARNCVRITPAYAGKSVYPESAPDDWRDHPRLCGEKTKKILKQRYFFHQPASFSFSLQYT